MKNKYIQDKQKEKERYDLNAELLLKQNAFNNEQIFGAVKIPLIQRRPYIVYESYINKLSFNGTKVLEIGAGTGLFTGTLLATGAHVTTVDISEHALNVILKRFGEAENLETQVADMESLPFDNEFFDVVTMAGSLSYGDNNLVMNEIYRVLKVGGRFVCVDSLNHNPIYRFNRYLHYLLGNRTLSTLKRMPTLFLLVEYEKLFGTIQVHYFGAISWLAVILSKFFNISQVNKFSDYFDHLFKIKKSAFKFVMVATKASS